MASMCGKLAYLRGIDVNAIKCKFPESPLLSSYMAEKVRVEHGQWCSQARAHWGTLPLEV